MENSDKLKKSKAPKIEPVMTYDDIQYTETLPDEMQEICSILNDPCKTEKELFAIMVQREVLLSEDVLEKLRNMVSRLKGKYKSDGLNCLHQNREIKQKFPGINLVRQIFKCNGYHLKPIFYSKGYCKHSGKKIMQRNFKVVRLTDGDSYSYGYMIGYNISHNKKMHNVIGILKK